MANLPDFVCSFVKQKFTVSSIVFRWAMFIVILATCSSGKIVYYNFFVKCVYNKDLRNLIIY